MSVIIVYPYRLGYTITVDSVQRFTGGLEMCWEWLEAFYPDNASRWL